MFHHQSSPTDIQMSVSVYIYCMFACVHVCVCGELTFPVSRITVFDVPSFIFSAKKADITGSFSALLHFKFGGSYPYLCVCVYKERTDNCVVSTLG